MESDRGEASRPVYGPVCKITRQKRQKKLLVLLFLDFTKNTTLHGLKYVTEKGLHIIEKLFWLVTFIGSAAICSFLIFNVWEKWRTNPLIVSFDAKHVSVNEVPFPSITICPNTQFLQEKFNYTKFWNAYTNDKINYAKVMNNTSYTLLNAERLTLLCDLKFYSSFLKNIPRFEYFDASAIDFMHKMFVDSEDVFYDCSWSLDQCSFSKVLTKIGLCFNFNGLQASDILNMNVVQREYNYTFASEKIRNWTMENGYSSNSFIEDEYPHRAIGIGGETSLAVSLKDLNSKKDRKCNGLSGGYKIYLHHPADLPQALMFSFSALPDRQTSLGVTFSMETSNINIKSYPVQIRQCYFAEEMPLNYFRIYTYNNCVLECLTNYTYKECGCVSFYMPYNDSTKICTPSKMVCVRIAELQFTGHEGSSGGKCKCLPSCDSIMYDADAVLSMHDLKALLEEHNKFLNIPNDPETFKAIEKSSYVKIFFKRSTFRTVHRSELYGLTDFLGNCGGLLGLFLGFSWLTLVEILYFLTFRVYKTIKTDLKQEKADRSSIILQNAVKSKNPQ